jgi:hypothetical protein
MCLRWACSKRRSLARRARTRTPACGPRPSGMAGGSSGRGIIRARRGKEEREVGGPGWDRERRPAAGGDCGTCRRGARLPVRAGMGTDGWVS